MLTWFNEAYTPQYLKDYKRPAIEKLTINLSTKADTLPRLRLVNTPRAGQESTEWAVLESSVTMDTLVYWITDSAIFDRDSLTVALEYMKTDTLGELSLAIDTLKMNVRARCRRKSATRRPARSARTSRRRWSASTSSTQTLTRKTARR